MHIIKKNRLFPFLFDAKPTFFLGWFLHGIFKKISINEDMKQELRDLQRQGTLVYAIKYRSRFDYLLCLYNLRSRRVPYPKMAFDLSMYSLLPVTRLLKVIIFRILYFFRYGKAPNPYQSGFYRQAVEQGVTSLIFLVDPKVFSRQFVHAQKEQLQLLIEVQKNMDRPIFIVPQIVLYRKAPERDHKRLSNIFFGFKDNPGIIRKILLFLRFTRNAVVDFGCPLNLKDCLETQPPDKSVSSVAVEIRQKLIEVIDSQKRVTLGPIMKSRQQVKELVLTDREVNRIIEGMADGNRGKRKKLKEKAEKYFEEIAADYNITYVQSFILSLSWFLKKIFEDVDINSSELSEVRKRAKQGPLIYVPSHKSHIDYLVLNYVLYTSHMHPPRIAAGENLTFWPMGHIFRKCGAFFIRRSFRGARLYSEVLNRYIQSLLEEGHPIEFFIEGGRSRNGKLILPKTGFLSLLINAYEKGFCKDLIFVPVSVIYDRVLEEKSYLKEIGGGPKERENFIQIIKARKFLKSRYGKVYIRFNQPFSLNDYLSTINVSAHDMTRELSFHLVKSINNVAVITPLSLVALAISCRHQRGFYIKELIETVGILLEFIYAYSLPVASTIKDSPSTVKEALSLLADWKVIDIMRDPEGEQAPLYHMGEGKRMELEYYKNSIIHFFILHSFVAVSLLAGGERKKEADSVVSDFAFLKNLFRNEFVYDSSKDLGDEVLPIIEYCASSGLVIVSGHGKTYQVTDLGIERLPIWAALAKTFLESYWVTAKSILQQKGKFNDRTSLLNKMSYLGKQLLKLGAIEHVGALSQLNFKNAINFINEDIVSLHELEGGKDGKRWQRLVSLENRLERLTHYQD